MSGTRSNGDSAGPWRGALAAVGGVVIVVALVLVVVGFAAHQVTKVEVAGKKPDLTTITTGHGVTSAALIGTFLAVGVVVLLVAAFFTRVTKIVFPGGTEIDLDTSAAVAGAVAAQISDPAEASAVYKRSMARVTELIASRSSAARPPTARRLASNTYSLLGEDEIKGIVANEYSLQKAGHGS